jgi:hypothetical protein
MKFPTIKVSEQDIKSLESARERVLAELDKPADQMKALDGPLAAFREIKGRIGRAGGRAVNEAILAFLVAHPEVEALRWSQASDEWNDEEYYFAIRYPEVKVAGFVPDSRWDRDGFQSTEDVEDRTLETHLNDLHRFFEDHEETMRATFGGDSTVTVGRDGVAVVEERERD